MRVPISNIAFACRIKRRAYRTPRESSAESRSLSKELSPTLQVDVPSGTLLPASSKQTETVDAPARALRTSQLPGSCFAGLILFLLGGRVQPPGLGVGPPNSATPRM